MQDDEIYGGDEDVEYYAVRPNKTRIKQEISALFLLAENLAKLAPAKLDGFELPDNLREAVAQVGIMPHTGARKRLLKYIAGQFHKMDVSQIQEQMVRLQNQSAHSAREHHLTEKWRDRLILEGDQALAELAVECTTVDTQKIRQLLRNIKKEAERSQPPTSARLLYRYLKNFFQPDSFAEDE
jgi:ribosome-associated protein